jgi:hypothetical protein
MAGGSQTKGGGGVKGATAASGRRGKFTYKAPSYSDVPF